MLFLKGLAHSAPSACKDLEGGIDLMPAYRLTKIGEKMRRWLPIVGYLLLLFVLAGYVMGSIDYSRVRKHKDPLFTINWHGSPDGGSSGCTYVGTGLGYSVYNCNGVTYSVNHGQPFTDCEIVKGPAVDFWLLPPLCRSDTQVTGRYRLCICYGSPRK